MSRSPIFYILYFLTSPIIFFLFINFSLVTFYFWVNRTTVVLRIESDETLSQQNFQ